MLLRLLVPLGVLFIAGCATVDPTPVHLETANVLPLELQPGFEIRKIKRYFFEPDLFERTASEAANFEQRYYRWGAVDRADIDRRRGNYFYIYWRNRTAADVTVRFEYRQEGLGNTVSAQEMYYPGSRGSHRSRFRVVGDEYLEFGRVTAWRVVLIVDGRIVAFRQSFLWR